MIDFYHHPIITSITIHSIPHQQRVSMGLVTSDDRKCKKLISVMIAGQDDLLQYP